MSQKTSFKTLNFLGHYPDEIGKDDLVNALIIRVKNFFLDICSICKNEYCINIKDTNFLACSSCGQKVHKICYVKALKEHGLISDSDNTILFLQIPGFHFLCGSCEDEAVLKTINHRNLLSQTPLNDVPLSTPHASHHHTPSQTKTSCRKHLYPDVIVLVDESLNDVEPV